MSKSSNADERWLSSPDYPEKRGICNVCKQKDDVKLAFDRVNFICKNSHACLLRFGKMYGKGA